MLGLGDYESSNDEAEDTIDTSTRAEKRSIESHASGTIGEQKPREVLHEPTSKTTTTSFHQKIDKFPDDVQPSGPQLGPSVDSVFANNRANGVDVALLSPYSSSRETIRNLTLPPLPNFKIPPSPPGSPPPDTTKKFARFLEMKNRGTHFNEKLEASSALRNPSLLQKLQDFAGINDKEQYSSTLPRELAIPTSLPNWMYADQLNLLQQEMSKRLGKDRAGRPLEFVPASVSGTSSSDVTPGRGSARDGLQSATERVMAGLDRERGGAGGGLSGAKRKDQSASRPRFDGR